MKKLALAFLATSFGALAQKKAELEPLEAQGFSAHSAKEKLSVFDQSRLTKSSKLHLDQVLLENPAFGTYRRSGSGIAHPTSQGVSLRGTGTSAASRSIVLLDGVPLNDPFGGWVRWNRFSPAELESVRFGRGSAFASSAENIYLNGRLPGNQPIHELRFAAGHVHGFSADGFAATEISEESWDATASFRVEDFSGHPVVRASQRGAIDEDAWSRMRAARTTVSRQLSSGRLTARLAGFDERRGNGTPLARNQGNGLDWSVGLQNEDSRTILFGQERDFASVFPKVETDRSGESVALDQYAVPAKSFGFTHLRSWETASSDFSLSLSALRREGHTHEDAYGKRRLAGGRQTQVGLSFADSRNPVETWSLETKLRGEWFRDDRGMRKRWQLSDNAVIEDEVFSARGDFGIGGSLALGKVLSDSLNARFTMRSLTRRPTLNELYRPFRVGDFSVASNENLVAERITGIELGLDWSPSELCSSSLTLFQDHLRDSVANLSSPTDPNDAQRINLERARAQGIEIALDSQLADKITLHLSGLLMETEVRNCPENPGIAGNRFAQVPQHRATASLIWSPASWSVRMDARQQSNCHDDVRNSRLLDDALTLDLSITHYLGENSRVSIAMRNLTASEVQTGRSASGLVSVGTPRSVTLGVAWEF